MNDKLIIYWNIRLALTAEAHRCALRAIRFPDNKDEVLRKQLLATDRDLRDAAQDIWESAVREVYGFKVGTRYRLWNKHFNSYGCYIVDNDIMVRYGRPQMKSVIDRYFFNKQVIRKLTDAELVNEILLNEKVAKYADILIKAEGGTKS